MEDLIKLDENHWQEKILTISDNYTRIDGMIKGKWKVLKKESWCYGCLKPQNLRVVNLYYCGKDHLKYNKCLITTLWSCLLLVMMTCKGSLQGNMSPIHSTSHSFSNEFHENFVKWIQILKCE